MSIIGPRSLDKIAEKVTVKILTGLLESFIDNVCRDKVYPVKGSIVYCDLGFAFEHSGVYVGDGKIVHRDGGGYLAAVSPKTFIDRLDGFNNAISIYVSCHDEDAVGSEKVAKRALAALSDPKLAVGYDLLENNCHHFCQYCLTGVEQGLLNYSFESLQNTMKKVYPFDNWRVWDVDISW